MAKIGRVALLLLCSLRQRSELIQKQLAGIFSDCHTEEGKVDYHRKLADLRALLTDAQRKVLAEIWTHNRQTNKPMPVRELLKKTNLDQHELLALFQPLGGSVVSWRTSGDVGFDLTFAGLLLLPEGREIEDLMPQIIAHMKRRSLEDTKLSHVTLSELQLELVLTSEQVSLLADAMIITPSINVGMDGHGAPSASLPYDIDTLSRRATLADFHSYVLQKALDHFIDGLPIQEHLQYSYQTQLQRSDQTLSVFWFVRDDRLRRLLASDWQEANDVLGVNAYRSCAILCGSILEGLLLDALSGQEEEARNVFQAMRAKRSKTGTASRPGPLMGWDLADLLTVAEELGVIQGIDLQLGDVVRDYRNLVHLGRQLKRSQEVTPNAAGIAIRAVGECLRALDERARRHLPQSPQPAP